MRVASLHRYPVKSMLGEAPAQVEVTRRGLAGDRGFALIDRATGLVASAKQPAKWGSLLQCRATLRPDGTVAVRLPDGTVVHADDDHVDEVLSAYCRRDVTLSSVPTSRPRLERWWPDVEGLAPPEAIAAAGTVTDLAGAAPATFFDYAPVHVVTTASLRALQRRRPATGFEPARFRPNIVLETAGQGFVENAWSGRLIVGGAELDLLTVTPRCAVPALAHGDLPHDPDVLRGVVAANRIEIGRGRFACVGIYARVARAGTLAVGDAAGVVEG